MAGPEPLTPPGSARTRRGPGTAAASGAEAEHVAGDAELALRLAPLLLAAALGLVPFTVLSTFLVDIAHGVGSDPVAIGGLRGLGGLAAIVVGAGWIALADRTPRTVAAAAALVLLGAGSLAALVPAVPALVCFCVAIGGATAVLNPALQDAAALRCAGEAERGRAATMVTATTTLTALLAGPVIGGLSLLVAWRGVLVIVAVVAAGAAIMLLRDAGVGTTAQAAEGLTASGGRKAPTGAGSAQAPLSPGPPPRLRRRTDLQLLIAVSGLRTAAFMGVLAVVAAVYQERHGITGSTFTLVWTISGAAFFAGNWVGGRRLAHGARPTVALALGVGGALVGLLLVLLAQPLPAMLAGTAVLALGHAVIAAAVTTLIVRGAGSLRSRALAVAGTAQSVGTFAGAACASLGYAWAGWPGTAAVLGAFTLGAGGATLLARRGPGLRLGNAVTAGPASSGR